MNHALQVARVAWAALAVPPWPTWRLLTGDPCRGLHPAVLDALNADPVGVVELPRGGVSGHEYSRRGAGPRPGDARRVPASRTATPQPAVRQRPTPSLDRQLAGPPASRRRASTVPGVPGRREPSTGPPATSVAPLGSALAGPPAAPPQVAALPGGQTLSPGSVAPGTGPARTVAAPAAARDPGTGAATAAPTLARILDLVVGLRGASAPASATPVEARVRRQDPTAAAWQRGGARLPGPVSPGAGTPVLSPEPASDAGPALDQVRRPAAWLHALASAQALPADAPGAVEHLRPTSSDEAPDAAALADLVNSELADQARRHGVDVA